jgi:hypothetical protein
VEIDDENIDLNRGIRDKTQALRSRKCGDDLESLLLKPPRETAIKIKVIVDEQYTDPPLRFLSCITNARHL